MFAASSLLEPLPVWNYLLSAEISAINANALRIPTAIMRLGGDPDGFGGPWGGGLPQPCPCSCPGGGGPWRLSWGLLAPPLVLEGAAPTFGGSLWWLVGHAQQPLCRITLELNAQDRCTLRMSCSTESHGLLTSPDESSTAVCRHCFYSAEIGKSGRGLVQRIPAALRL